MSITNYNNVKDLEGMFRSMWGEVAKEHPGNGKGKGVGTYKIEAKRCASLYANSASIRHSFVVLGEASIREDRSLMDNLGTISTNPVFSKSRVKDNFNKAFPDLGKKINGAVNTHLTQGAILNEGNWFILPNDMVILGIIHSGKECHLATEGGKIPGEESLWDKKEGRLRVLGRELLQLYHGGYRIVRESLDGRGIQLLQVDEVQSKSTHLKDIRQAAKVSTLDEIQNIFQDVVPYNATVKGKAERL